MKIAIFGNTFQHETEQLVLHVIRLLKSSGVTLELGAHLIQHIRHSGLKPFNPQKEELPDVALSIGGDGTFLTTVAHVAQHNIPILGINGGRLGFLADVSAKEVEEVLMQLIHNRYTIEKRSALQVTSPQECSHEFRFALNEVAVLKRDISSMICVEMLINNEHVHTYQADGLIIATPTGSTAYNMSVGGPLMVPQANNFIISPVATHSLTVRPLVIPDSWEIRLKVKSRSHNYLVSLDGRSHDMDQNQELVIKRSPLTVKVVKMENHSFFNSLKNKLMWGADTRNGYE